MSSSDLQSSTLTWHNPHFPGYPQLNNSSALYYFCNVHNPFYDASSLNEQIRAQGLSEDILRSDDIEGVRYSVVSALAPRLFIISKHEKRRDENGAMVHAPNGRQQPLMRDEHLAMYYILDGVVYQAPILYDVIDARIQNCMTDLEKILVEMQDCLRLGVDGSHYWEFPGDEELRRKERELFNDEYTIRERSIYPSHVQNHVAALIQQMEHETIVEMKEKQDLEKQRQEESAGVKMSK